MGNKPSSELAGRPAPARKGLHFKFRKDTSASSSAGAGAARAGAEGTADAALQNKCPVEVLLEAINLGIYTDAFLLAGHGSSNAADLALLTTADLAQICVVSKVPIIPQHQSLILAASKQLAVTLGILQDASPAQQVDHTAAATTAARGTLCASPAAGADAASDAAATCDPAGRAQLAPDAARSGSSSSKQGYPQQHPTGNAGVDQQCANYQQQQQQQGRESHQDGSCTVNSPCPLMNPFLCDSSGVAAASPAAARAAAVAATAEGGGGHTAAAPAAGWTSSNADSSSHSSGQQGVALGPASRSQPSSYATASSASRGSISGSDADANRPGSSSNGSKLAGAAVPGSKDEQRPVSSHSSRSQRAADVAAAAASALTQASMHLDRVTMSERARQQQRQLQAQEPLAGAAGVACAGNTDRDQHATVDGTAVDASTVAMQAAKRPGEQASAAATAQPVMPGPSEIEPAKPQCMRPASAQHGAGQASDPATCSASASAAAAAGAGADAVASRDVRSLAAQRSFELRDKVLMCSAPVHAGMRPAPAHTDARGATTCTGLAAAAAAFAAPADDCWFQDLDWDDSNPFLIDVLPAYQHSGAEGPAGDDSGHGFSNAPASECAYDEVDGEVPFAEAAAAAVAAGRAEVTGRAAAAVAAGAAANALGGPLTARWSQLLRASSSRGFNGKQTLSSPAVTAAAAAKLSALRKHGSAWEKLPGEVACMSYAATASLRSKPLPALAAVASGQPKKQRAVQAQPGALTVNASQLPQRPVSESDFSMRSVRGRHPGLCAEDSAASAAVALQALVQQQASNQDLIQRLLHAPPAEPQQAMGPDASPVIEQIQGQLGYSAGYNLSAQGSALLLPEGSAVSSVLAPSAHFVLVQQQPQLYAQYSSSSGSFFAPVGMGGGFGGNPAQQQQVVVLGPQVWSAAQRASGPVPVLSGSLPQERHAQQQAWRAPSVAALNTNRSARMQGAQHTLQAGGMLPAYAAAPAARGPLFHHQQQEGYVLQQQRSSASVAGSAAGQRLGNLSSAQSCIELGACAADVGNIVLKAKARAAAKQELQQLQVTPTTPVLGNRLLDEMAQGQLKGAAAMLAGKPRHAPAAAVPAARPVWSAAGASAGAAHALAYPQSAASTDARPGGSGSAAVGALQTPKIPAAVPVSGRSTGSSLAAAVRDGDRVLQMLHDYKELSELDKAVKSRMMQLLHTAAVPGSKVASQAQATAAPAAAVASTAVAYRNSAVTADAAVQRAPNVLAEVHVQHRQAGVTVRAAAQGGNTTAAAALGAVGGNNSCAGVLQAAADGVHAVLYAGASGSVLRPQASGSITGASAVDAPGQSTRAAGDQASTAMQLGYQHKAHAQPQHSVQSDQQQKLAGLHRSPNHKAASNSSYLSAHAGDVCAEGTSGAVQDAHAGKRTAARQLWQRDCAAGAAAAAAEKGAHAAPSAAAVAVSAPTAGLLSSGSAQHPAAEVLSAAGWAPMVGVQRKKGISVAALVAAVAGRPLRPAVRAQDACNFDSIGRDVELASLCAAVCRMDTCIHSLCRGWQYCCMLSNECMSALASSSHMLHN